MRCPPRLIVNTITLSRVPLALVIVVTFQPNALLLAIAGLALALAFVTDFIDGKLARKFSVASLDGLLLDSLADKSVYVAAFIAMANTGILSPVLAWALIFRDIAMYVYRLMRYDKIENIIRTKKYSRIHGFFVYITILSGYINMMYTIDRNEHINLALTNILALVTLGLGVYTAVKFTFIKQPSE